MSILDRAAGGSVLELPVEQVTDRASGDQSEADALRQRVIDGLFWYQRPIVEDAEHRMVAFVAGYGAGKTRTLAAWATVMSLDNPGCVGVLFAPTGPLVRDVLIRTLEDYWTEIEVEFEYRVTPLPEFRLYLPMGTVTILCRSMENWSRIIGINAAWIGADEIDTSKTEIARRAVEKFLGRLRAGTRRQLGMFSTPEGFGILYNLFVEEGHKTDRALYRAKSTDNPHLPADFIEGMRENYPPAMLKSYLDGEFTNLTQASVYPEFNRDLNASEISAPTESDTIFAGVDFNVDRCIIAICIQRADGVHVVAEHVARDTPGVIETILDRYGGWVDHGQLVMCPDASSQSRSTKNAGISDFGLMKQAGLRIQTQASNPFIRDRVLTVNSLILNAKGERRLFVHTDCKLMIKGLEQHAYDQATQQPEKGDGGQDDLSGQMDALGYATWQMAGITAWGVKGHNRKSGLAQRKLRIY
jgi:phage terminase large subunit-like protein